MAKYHIKKDGTPGVCHAKNGNCPLGSSSEHFSSPEEAQQHAQAILESRYGYSRNTAIDYHGQKVKIALADDNNKISTEKWVSLPISKDKILEEVGAETPTKHYVVTDAEDMPELEYGNQEHSIKEVMDYQDNYDNAVSISGNPETVSRYNEFYSMAYIAEHANNLEYIEASNNVDWAKSVVDNRGGLDTLDTNELSKGFSPLSFINNYGDKEKAKEILKNTEGNRAILGEQTLKENFSYNKYSESIEQDYQVIDSGYVKII